MLIDLYNNRIYLPPDPDDRVNEKGEEKNEVEDCLPPREEFHVMSEAGDQAMMLYLEQETVIMANTMRVCKVTYRNLHDHEDRLF